ncbi:MAG: PEP-CTERM sorting domain-containing protein [Deltaproteobacteria bacterium]|nr:PEP-CTERM sorting domain-containing protein [Deltaproteobacteria bacterium]
MKRKMLLTLSALLLSATSFSIANAEPKFWDSGLCGSGGSWTTADACWSGSGQPASGDSVYLRPGLITGGYTVTYDSNSNITLEDMKVGEGSPGTVTLEITAPFASIDTVNFSVGAGSGYWAGAGSGVVAQSGGTVGSDSLVLGLGNGDSGSYTLTGGSLFADTEIIGDSGSGVFTHDGATGSSNTTNDATTLFLGHSYGSNGTYNLGAGELTSNVQYIGYEGTGEFIQTSPLNSHNTTNSLYLGYDNSGTGTYTMMGGWLTAGSESIGDEGTGTFTQWGGLNSVSGDLTIGFFSGSSGAYSMIGVLGGNPTLAVADDIYVGKYGEGTFTQDGGSITAVNEYIGYQSGGVGSFTQNSGTNTVSGALYLGYVGSGIGTYNLSGGWTSVLSAGAEVVGHDGNGVFNQSGGWNIVSTNLIVGSGAGTGEYNLSGGTVSASNENIGIGTGLGVFDQTGGSNQVSGTLTIGTNGTYNLNSLIIASLYAGTIVNNGTINYSGGNGHITATGGNICTYCGNYDPNATTFENNGTLNISGAGAKTITGNVTNNGTVNAVNTDITFNGTFVNNGEYFSDPSSSYFDDLIINPTGYLVGGTGDNFFISGDLMNYSDQTSLWYTADSYLGFTGTTLHEFYLGGWDSASSMSFSWDTLELSDGGSIFLNGGTGASLYVDNLILSAGSSLDLNGFSLYYYSLTDFGGSYFNGQLISLASNGGSSEVPEPSTLLLLGSGIAGLAGLRRFYRRPNKA